MGFGWDDYLIMLLQNRQGCVLPWWIVLGHINGTVGWLLGCFFTALLKTLRTVYFTEDMNL